MRKIAFLIAICGATIWLQLCSAPAYATSARTWISRSGNDNNPCSESSPCLSFAGALAKTAAGGEVDCLDAGDYSSPAQTAVTFSVTIDCHGFNAANFNPGTGDGIEINAPGGIVVLRGLTFNFAGNASSIDVGIYVQAATTVHIEDCTIMGFRYGVADIRTTGLTQLFIKNTVIRDNRLNGNSPGIFLVAAPKNSVVLENVQLLSNGGYGVAVATGNNVVISRSVISGNGIAGIEVDAGAQVMVDNTEISHNVSYGILTLGSVALANSDISFNTTSISGTTLSYGNNRLFGNGGGTAPTPIGGSSTDFGQQ